MHKLSFQIKYHGYICKVDSAVKLNRITSAIVSVSWSSARVHSDLYSGLKDYRRLSTVDGFSSKLINVLIFGSGLDLCSLLKLHSLWTRNVKSLVWSSSPVCGVFVFGVEMRPAPPGGGPAGEGRADEGAGPAVLPHHADGEAHGAQSWPALQAEDHQRLLSPVRRTGISACRPGTQFIYIASKSQCMQEHLDKTQTNISLSVVRCRTCGFSCRKRVLQASRPPSTPRTTWSLRTAPTGTRTPAASLLKRSSPSSQVRARGRYYSLNMCASELDLSLSFTFICAPQVVEGAWPKGKGARCTCTLHISMEATASWAHRWAHLKSLSHLHVSVVKHSLQFQ